LKKESDGEHRAASHANNLASAEGLAQFFESRLKQINGTLSKPGNFFCDTTLWLLEIPLWLRDEIDMA